MAISLLGLVHIELISLRTFAFASALLDELFNLRALGFIDAIQRGFFYHGRTTTTRTVVSDIEGLTIAFDIGPEDPRDDLERRTAKLRGANEDRTKTGDRLPVRVDLQVRLLE